VPLPRQAPDGLKTPRAAAVAGILFSVLLLTAVSLILQTLRLHPQDRGEWLGAQSWKVALALNLIPFAGVAFLWFMGVLRDRLGTKEHKLFETVFLGSGLLFVGMLFTAAAAIGAILITHAASPRALSGSVTFTLARAFAYNLTSIYAMKVASVFLLTASTIVLRTGITARWTAMAGYAAAAFILLGSHALDWTFLVFPLWVLLVSGDILLREYRQTGSSS
jgi:MFS family permease